ncbi:histidine phosphatase family protein [Lacrimispora brassicae]
MKLILIRHGEPDYSIDSLTEKGWREADLLSERMGKQPVSAFYCSPLGRAKDTAKATLDKSGAEAEILPWLREFYAPVEDGGSGTKRIPWDFMPGYWTNREELYHRDLWFENERMKTGPVKEEYEKVAAGLDEILKKHGYEREGRMYRAVPGSDDTIVLFCHFGVICVMLSHLLGIPAPLLWQGFFLAPSSVTTLETEERLEGEAYFRCKGAGDTAHLYAKGEPGSNSGFFPRQTGRYSD